MVEEHGGAMEVIAQEVSTRMLPRGRLLGVLPHGDGALACFFAAPFPPVAVTNVDGFEVDEIRPAGAGLMVVGRASTDAPVRLPLSGEPQHAPVLPPRRDLFAGRDTALLLREREDARTVSEWLAFHAAHHGLQAALIVDRGGSGLVDGLRAAPVAGVERVVVLSFDIPLGRADMGDESHPFNAPDAPGKDRMEPPAPDPVRAPFGEMVVYEFLRWLYLEDAAGVLHLSASDLLAPEGGPVFEAARAARWGRVTLLGERIYPWGLDGPPRFADHVCRRFDGGLANPRWCLAPRQLPPGAVWRMIRIGGTPMPVVEDARRYWRCMSLRHPAAKISEIVPKSSLVEDDGLLALMSRWDHVPQRAPAEELAPAATSGTNRTGIVTTMKNEGPFILEWIAYHRAIGVQDFLIYTNDCDDGTDTFLKLLDRKGIVRHRENPYRASGLKPQHAALQDADDDPVLLALDWVICMDVDEFIDVHVGEGRLADLYAAVPDANMISLTWRLFGNGDVERYVDEPVIAQFTHCAPELVRKPHQAWGFKTLTRNAGIFKKLGVHRPKGLKPQLVDEINWVNGSGTPMPRRDYRTAWRSTLDTYGYDLVTLNHYALRSAESFLVKRDRGRVNHVDRDQGLNYWFRMNHNAERDHAIQRMLPALRAEMDALLSDPEIAAGHAACVAAHRAKIDALMATPKYRAFYAEITGPRLRRLSRMLSHFGSAVFLAGPDVIPDDALERSGDPQFFFTVDKAEAEH